MMKWLLILCLLVSATVVSQRSLKRAPGFLRDDSMLVKIKKLSDSGKENNADTSLFQQKELVPGNIETLENIKQSHSTQKTEMILRIATGIIFFMLLIIILIKVGKNRR